MTISAPSQRASARWTTPRRLQAAQLAIGLAALLFCLATMFGVRQRRGHVQSIGKDAAPSILAAQSMKANLADMDANVVNELIVRKGESAQSIQGYEARHQQVAEGLVRAAENITYGDKERLPILTLVSRLGTYEELVARVRLLHERRDPAEVTAYRQAYRVLEETLFPAADALTKANSEVLDQTYGGVQTASAFSFFLALLTGSVLLAALLGAQVFLSRRMRRTLNPGLLAATLLTLAFLFYALRAFGAESRHLKVVKEDAFASLMVLWKARAVAYDANTDESRWLFDREKAADYEAAFFDKSAQLTQFPKDEMYARVAAAGSEGRLSGGVEGYFATELNNITFEGEKEAATDMLRNYAVYFGMDKKIRDLEHSGHHEAAVRFCVSNAQGDSNWAFGQFDDALGRVLTINQRAFDTAVEQSFGDLKGLDFVAPGAAVVVVILAFAGLRPRLQEYSF
jgi:hypothetical protein